MANIVLLDTDVLIDVARAVPKAVSWLKTLQSEIGVSSLVAMELINGCLNKQEQRNMQRTLDKLHIFYINKTYAKKALTTFSEVHLRNGIGIIDVLIAYTAIQENLLLYTRNKKHYQVVKGLQFDVPY